MGLFGDDSKDSLVLAVVIVVLLLITFSDQISYFLSAVKTTVVAMIEGKERLPCGCFGRCTCSGMLMPDEHFQDPIRGAGDPNTVTGGSSDTLTALGMKMVGECRGMR